MASRVPHVFLSSTSYDLRQVRADLASFVERDLGYRLIASEFNSFPVDPDANAIENCRRRVSEDADLFVLIIGTRYGFIPLGSEHSVTNLEYLAARAKGIPIYAFARREVLAILPLYAASPDSDFSESVESTKVLEFVKDLQGEEGVWLFPFEHATEIIDALRTQFAYQMGNGLLLAARARVAPRHLLSLTAAAFRVALEQPPGWEARLFVHVLEDEIASADDMRRDHEAEVVLGRGELVRESDISDWILSAIDEGRRMVAAMESVAKAAINAGFSTGDIPAIVYGARRLGAFYREAFEWSLRIRRARVPDRWRTAQKLLASLLDDFTAECRDFVTRIAKQISQALESDAEGTIRLTLVFNFHIGNAGPLNAEIARVRSD